MGRPYDEAAHVDGISALVSQHACLDWRDQQATLLMQLQSWWHTPLAALGKLLSAITGGSLTRTLHGLESSLRNPDFSPDLALQALAHLASLRASRSLRVVSVIASATRIRGLTHLPPLELIETRIAETLRLSDQARTPAKVSDIDKTEAAQLLRQYLEADAILRYSAPPSPCVSVVIVLYNAAELTLLCLKALELYMPPYCELIIVDNNSTDRTHELLAKVDGARIVNSATNLHFIRGANLGASVATGEYLLFLNNDAQIRAGSIEAALDTFATKPDVGAVGGKVILPNGLLQEAGSVVLSDGSTQGLLRGLSPRLGLANFRRPVDYCSGVFLMIRKDLFDTLGMFSELYLPAYYEDVDLCLKVWESGRKVYFDPAAEVVHFEHGSGTADAARELMLRNRATLVDQHRDLIQRRAAI